MRPAALLLVLAALPAVAQGPSPNGAAAKPAPAAPPRQGRIGASAQRNENVAVYQIDNDAIKEANVRMGTTTTLVSEAAVDTSWFAAEHGRPPAERLMLNAVTPATGWHGELFAQHQNSVFNARTFFQVGGVRPSRRNVYGGRATGAIPRLGDVTFTGSQRKIRGMVNGNVLIPLPEERSPLTTDPAARAFIERIFASYPNVRPNRPDFDPRALNTNAPQSIDETDGTLRLDRDAAKGRLTMFQSISRQRISAFQLVAGQNPDSALHTLRSRLQWRRALSPATELSLGASFHRARTALVPEPDAIGPRIRFGFQIEELGPDSQYPIDRAQNTFRYGGGVSHTAGRHQFTFGGDLFRYRLNGIETNNQRGYFQFTNNFGRTAIENLRYGTPTNYEVTLGELSRGFRNWAGDVYFGDRFRLHPRLQVYYGLRYNFETAPIEVRRRDVIPYRCDCNNFSPRLSLAWQPGGGWTARASYGVSFSRIQPVTFQQVRNNLPLVRYVIVQNPDLMEPLRGVDLNSPAARHTPTNLSSDLVGPYAHLYTLSFERRLFDRWLLRTGYTGSRSFKLLNAFIDNRAEVIPGIPLTTATVDRRRPDSRYYDVRTIVNAGIAYFDAGQVSLDIPLRRGFASNISYTFSKAIDEGSDFAFTAANRDLLTARSQSMYEVLKDKKGLSLFDSTHALGLTWTYDLPKGFQISGASVIKSGTPLTLYIGSDAPGFGNVDGGPSDRPNIVDPSILGKTVGNPDTAPSIIARQRFAYITPGEYRGSLGRGTFRKGGIANLNAAIGKTWRWRSDRATIFRVESYNLTNTPQFDEPQRNLTSPSFGRITNTLNDGRVLQLVVRLVL
ncbi:MAG: TonB-dependent receptor [Bryobacteraceae bacterium]|nr:TonB-dependent receptor [Bryobacteraceae bacterium]